MRHGLGRVLLLAGILAFGSAATVPAGTGTLTETAAEKEAEGVQPSKDMEPAAGPAFEGEPERTPGEPAFEGEPERTPEEPAGQEEPGEEASGDSGSWFTPDSLVKLGAGFGAGLLVALIIGGAAHLLSDKKKPQRREPEAGDSGQEEQEDPRAAVTSRFADGVSPSMGLPDANKGTLGMVHHIGRRKNQQDTLGTTLIRQGLLAVVSDGMGGLSDGEKVSQKAVMGMFTAGTKAASFEGDNPLYEMVSETNEQVLKMLGPDQIYKSGATLLAVLVQNSSFHWVSVGDSRIYLYCHHHLFQINREHIYKKQLIDEAVNRNISFTRVNTDPQRDRLVSFLGMGELKHIDGSLRPVEVKQGDKLLLMSDGIFNTIREQEILTILETTENAAAAAARMEEQVLAANNLGQDNFTCIILDF